MTASKNIVQFRGDEPVLDEDSRWILAKRVAGSSALSRATQLRAILLYVVRQAILQPEQPIHESDIAHRVLGRRMDFNPLDDNIVRVQMAHLRKKLDLYFSTEGKAEEVAIGIALGSYQPVFSNRIHPASTSKEPPEVSLDDIEGRSRTDGEADARLQDPVPRPQPASVRRRWALAPLIAVGLAMLALAVCCVVLWVQNRAMERSLNAMQGSIYPWKSAPSLAAFWSEFQDANRDTDIVMSDAFFKLAQDMTKKSFTLNDYLSGNYIKQLHAQEKNPDMLSVLSKVASWRSSNENHLKLALRILALDPLHKNMHLYYARDYRPDLIRQDSVILLGSRLTNPWDDLVESRMNFVPKFDSNDITTITNLAPATGEQAFYARTDNVGYCLVAFLPNSSSKGKVLLIEGTSVESTEAGGDFVLSEDSLSNFQKMLNVNKLPYFEMLLKTSQVWGTPLTATVEAYRTYPNLK